MENDIALSHKTRLSWLEDEVSRLQQALRDALDALTLPELPTYPAHTFNGMNLSPMIHVHDWTARRDLVARTLREGRGQETPQ
jgi:hypothetical protein